MLSKNKFIRNTAGLILSICATQLCSQITITQNDIGAPGLFYSQASDTTFLGRIGTGGPNMTWDYTADLGIDTSSLNYLLPPSQVPSAAPFSSCNLIISSGGGINNIFLSSTSSSLSVVGVDMDISSYGLSASNAVVDNNPDEVLINFPATYQSSFTGTSKGKVNIPFTMFPGVDSLQIRVTRLNNSLVDAWGQLSTPLGTMPVIRQKITTTQKDSILFRYNTSPTWQVLQTSTSVTDRFVFWANGVGMPVLEIDSVTSGPDAGKVSASWMQSVSGVKEQELSRKVNVYPNPLCDVVNIELSDNHGEAIIEIYNGLGELCERVQTMNNKYTLDMSAYKKGIYHYTVRTNRHSESGKLVKLF
jgi:hypothetical protein